MSIASAWESGSELLTPAHGGNDGPVPYFTYEGHDFEQEPGVEVPVDTVYAQCASSPRPAGNRQAC
jgi:hypothetical protein